MSRFPSASDVRPRLHQHVDREGEYSGHEDESTLSRTSPTTAVQILDEAYVLHGTLLRKTSSHNVFGTPHAYRRRAVTDLLGACAQSIRHWDDAMANQVQEQSPVTLLRQIISLVYDELGPGDEQVRQFLLQQLLVVKRDKECRQLLLDCLPMAMPFVDSINSRADGSINPCNDQLDHKLYQVAAQVIKVLRQVLSRDETALLPVLGTLTSIMHILPDQSGSKKNPRADLRSEPFQMAIDALPYVAEAELPALLNALLFSVATKEQATLAVTSLRREWKLLEQQQGSVDEANDNLPLVVDVVLSNLSIDWTVRRDTSHSAMEHTQLLASACINCLIDDISGGEGGASSVEDNLHSKPMLLDLAILLFLSNTEKNIFLWTDSSSFRDTKNGDLLDVDRLFYSWVSQGRFPFHGIQTLARLVCGSKFESLRRKRRSKGYNKGQSSILYPKLAPAMLRISLLLLLYPANARGFMSSSDPALQQTVDFILDLHDHFDRDLQDELMQSCLQLRHETFFSSEECRSLDTEKDLKSRKKRKALKTSTGSLHFIVFDDMDHRARRLQVHQHVNAVLEAFASGISSSARDTLLRYKTDLIEDFASLGRRLSCEVAAIGDVDFIEAYCRVISKLVGNQYSSLIHESSHTEGFSHVIEGSEIMMLLQKLLFASSISPSSVLSHRSTEQTSKVACAIILASELLRAGTLSAANEDCLKQWVVRLLLPPTRRTVDPEIGIPGLEFLMAWMDSVPESPASGPRGSSESTVFRHFKLLLSNTGLVQMLRAYQRNSKTLLAYSSTPEYVEAAVEEKGGPQAMVFCVAFFLKRSDLASPFRWRSTVKWVFHLMDAYLRIGRDKTAARWRPHGWLLASIEFPSFGEVSTGNMTDFVTSNICRGDPLVRLFEQNSDIGSSAIRKWLDHCQEGEIRKLLSSINRFTFSQFVGIAAVAAVLRNSFTHFITLGDGDALLFRLIIFQLIKIYDMRHRIKLLGHLSNFVQVTLDRSERRTSGVNLLPERGVSWRHGSPTVSWGDASLQMQQVDSLLFDSTEIIPPAVLCACLMNDDDGANIHDVLTVLSSCGENDLVTEDVCRTFSSMIVKSMVAKHLEELITSPKTQVLERDSLVKVTVHCFWLSKFLVGIMPQLRTGYFSVRRKVSAHFWKFSQFNLVVYLNQFISDSLCRPLSRWIMYCRCRWRSFAC